MNKCIQAAQQLPRPLSLQDLLETNRRLHTPATAPRATSKSSNLLRIRELHELVDQRLRSSTPAKASAASGDVGQAERVLNAFTHHKQAQRLQSLVRPKKDKVLSIFAKLANQRVSSMLFQSTPLRKLTKLFVREFQKHSDKDLGELAEVGKLLLNNWQVTCLLEKTVGAAPEEDDFVDSQTISEALKQVVHLLAQKGFSRKKSEALAEDFQRVLRNLTVSTSISYSEALPTLLQQLSESSREKIEECINMLP